MPLERLLDNMPEHLAQSPTDIPVGSRSRCATATQGYDAAAYRAWSDARYEYVARYGYTHLDLIREEVRRLMNPPKERS